MRLEGKTALVTGAGRGIGRAIALKLAAEGADVVVNDIIAENAQAVAREVEALGRRGRAAPADITDLERVQAMVDGAIASLGKLDVLVNNAGWDKFSLFSESDPQIWDRIIAINLKGMLNCTKAVLRHMAERQYGKIVNIASDAGRVGSTGESVYSACKGGIIAFTKTLAREVARQKINVNCVCPGPTETALWQSMGESELGQRIVDGMRRAIPLARPLGRLGQPEDIANAVAFFASDEAEWITGQTLSVSGGLTMS